MEIATEIPTKSRAQGSPGAQPPGGIGLATSTTNVSGCSVDVQQDSTVRDPHDTIPPATSETTLNPAATAAIAHNPKTVPESEHEPVSAIVTSDSVNASAGGPKPTDELGGEQRILNPKPAWGSWLLEIGYCLTSFAAFTSMRHLTIMAALRAFEGRALPNLPMDITLNTFVAFFATACRHSFITVIQESLAQWKWNMASSASRDTTVHDPLEDVVLDGPTVPAYKASLPPAADSELVSPLSWTYALVGRSASLAFNDDPNDKYTAITHLYLIYSNAGNVSYPGYDRTANSDEPWQFRAVEVLCHVCVSSMEANYENGNSTTFITSSSLDISENKPLDNVICDKKVEGSLERLCRFEKVFQDIGALYLQDPEAPNDRTSYFTIDRQLASILTEHVNGHMLSNWPWDGPGKAAQVLLTVVLQTRFRAAANGGQKVSGVAWADETYVVVHWGWAAFLATEMLLSYLFLATTIYRTTRLGVPVLKSSGLATLLASTDELSAKIGSVKELDKAVEISKSVSVKLEDGKFVSR
ncbi:hypothetical protein OQA88_9189 [Cercophora sp. LCS_1]